MSQINVEGCMDYREKSEVRDGMQIDWDMPIKMDDGLVLRCDVYRPIGDGKHPVIMTYGPYGKSQALVGKMAIRQPDRFKAARAFWIGLGKIGLTPAALLRQARLPSTLYDGDL